jgi:hypothetical protein
MLSDEEAERFCLAVCCQPDSPAKELLLEKLREGDLIPWLEQVLERGAVLLDEKELEQGERAYKGAMSRRGFLKVVGGAAAFGGGMYGLSGIQRKGREVARADEEGERREEIKNVARSALAVLGAAGIGAGLAHREDAAMLLKGYSYAECAQRLTDMVNEALCRACPRGFGDNPPLSPRGR